MCPYPPTRTESTPRSEADLASDPRWQLIERILLTPPFQKSANLHDLLSYLAENSIRGRLDILTERHIGEAAFGKPEGYSPAEDSGVRVHVRQLRLRLHEYSACEGRKESLVVEIPKGSYILEFRPVTVEPRSTLEASAETPAPAGTKPRFGLRNILLAVACAGFLICAAGWFRAATRNSKPSIPWPLNAVIEPNQRTSIVVSDSNSMLRLLSPHQITLDQYLQPGFRRSLIPPHVDKTFVPLLDYITESQLTSFADLVVASSLLRLAAQNGNALDLYAAPNLNLHNLEQGNYIFVGSPSSNPWVELYANRLNFEAVEEGVGGRMYFRNKKPLPGEQPTYEGLSHTGSAGDEYATISLLPGTSGHGHVLILQGLRQEGTEALGVLLEDSERRAQLRKAMNIPEDSRNPVFFEVLLRAQAVAGAPFSIRIVATRIIHP